MSAHAYTELPEALKLLEKRASLPLVGKEGAHPGEAVLLRSVVHAKDCVEETRRAGKPRQNLPVTDRLRLENHRELQERHQAIPGAMTRAVLRSKARVTRRATLCPDRVTKIARAMRAKFAFL